MGFAESRSLSATSAELASVVRRGNVEEELNQDDEFQFRRFSLATFRYYENVHYQYRLGLYDEVEFSEQKGAWASYIARSPGASQIWCEWIRAPG